MVCAGSLAKLKCCAFGQTASRFIEAGKRAMNLQEFVRDQNIRRYRRFLSTSKAETERQTILKLLSEAIDKENSQIGPKLPKAR